MRTIPAATQTLLENDYGEEIIVVLEIFWNRGSNEKIWYADREISGAPEVKSSILEVPGVDAAVQVSRGGQSQSVRIRLDDTDGSIKAIYDTTDIHKVPVRVWGYVNGSTFSTDKFKIFLGQINSPVVWSEGRRTLSFNVVNRIEDVKIGFSAEEGNFTEVAEELIGKPWPLCFGSTLNIPAVKAVSSVSGTLQNGVGIKDFTLANRINLADAITCPQTPIGYKCFGGYPQVTCNIAYEQDQNCLLQKCYELEKLRLQLEEQAAHEYETLTIFNGERFPQGQQITLNINGGLFSGQFTGTSTAPTNIFTVSSRQHPDYDTVTGALAQDPFETQLKSRCPASNFQAEDSDYTDSIHGPLYTGLRSSRISWENYRQAARGNFFWAQAGSTVTIENLKEIVYIANIVPSTIHSVRAVRNVNGAQLLLTVPDEYYTIRETDYGGYTVEEIVFDRPLSSEGRDTGGGWTDDIYITQTSTVGPNPVAIIQWIIETYTDYSIDSTSFADTTTKLDNYPMDLPILDRPGLLNILQTLARQARCALWQRDDTFFIKYLAETPTSVATLSEDDVLRTSAEDDGVGTLEIELTSTEDLNTNYEITWRDDYSPLIKDDKKLILRHNYKKYGAHDKEEHYQSYAHLDLVRKTGTFWQLRESNSWKRVKFRTTLEFAKLEPFDAVTLNLPDLASENVLGMVERAVLHSAEKEVELEIWTPVRAGEMTAYTFAYPSGLAEAAEYPPADDLSLGYAGSGTEPNFSTVAPPGHALVPDRTGIFTSISLACNGAPTDSQTGTAACRPDRGDRRPSDTGDTKPSRTFPTDNTGSVSGTGSPVSNGAGYGWSSNFFQNNLAQQKIEGDAGRARENAEGGGSGQSQTSGDNSDAIETTFTASDLDNLPSTDDDDSPYKCVVTVNGFKRKESFHGVLNKTICVNDGLAYSESYSFNQSQAATDFCDRMNGASNCGQETPCGPCISSCTIVCTGDPADEGDGRLTGYTPTSGGSSADAFMLLVP